MDNYSKSNSIGNVSLKRFSSKEYKNLLAAPESLQERAKAAQKLCDYLCAKFKIVPAKVIVTNRAQPHKTGYSGRLERKTLGTYTTGLRVITIYSATAIQKKTVSIKVFAATFLHEFIHHYDMEYLKLEKTIHCTGFYKRIADLETKLS